MSVIPSNLAVLRRRIDEIDDRMHDLLIERAEVVAQVAASKKGGKVAFYQPAREAQILRRLAARHRGALPFSIIVRIWREMLAATVRLETPFSVIVLEMPEGQGFWDLARDHYGSHAALSACHSAVQVIGAVAANPVSVGVLPMPRTEDPDPWWPRLMAQPEGGLQIVARLPFGSRGNARPACGDALVVGHGAHRETGADRTLFGAASPTDIGRGRFLELLSAADLACIFFASSECREGAVSLIEIDGFVPAADPRLAGLRARLGAALGRLVPLGGYALPLPAAASADAAGD